MHFQWHHMKKIKNNVIENVNDDDHYSSREYLRDVENHEYKCQKCKETKRKFATIKSIHSLKKESLPDVHMKPAYVTAVRLAFSYVNSFQIDQNLFVFTTGKLLKYVKYYTLTFARDGIAKILVSDNIWNCVTK